MKPNARTGRTNSDGLCAGAEWAEDGCNVEAALQSFHKFIDFPVQTDGISAASDGCSERCLNVIDDLDSTDFEQTDDFYVLSAALRENPMLMLEVDKKADIKKIVWCLGQCIKSGKDGVDFAIEYIQKNLLHPINLEFDFCNCMLLIMNLCLDFYEMNEFPPFTSDEVEVVFCLAFCQNTINVNSLAALVVEKMARFASESSAAHLLFRRLLPYCSMESENGRNFALTYIEEIFSNHKHFLSCISTWISLHRLFLFYKN